MTRPTSPPWCPHCGARPADLADHLRDTGATHPRPAGACPTLFAARNPLEAAQ